MIFRNIFLLFGDLLIFFKSFIARHTNDKVTLIIHSVYNEVHIISEIVSIILYEFVFTIYQNGGFVVIIDLR